MNHETFGRRDLFKRAAAGASAAALMTQFGGPGARAYAATPESGAVPTRTLGATGEKIPIVAVGAFANVNAEYDPLLHRAFNEGCFYYDAAEAYGAGKYHIALGNFVEQVGRKNIWITSKSGMFKGKEAMPPEQYRDVIEKEFPSLKTDYVDLYFFHGLRHLECLDKPYLDMVDDMKKRGRTRHFGFSCHDGNVVDLMNKAADLGSGAIQVIMFKYSFAAYGDLALNKAIDRCTAAGIGLIAMKTQMSVPTDGEEVKKFESDGGFSLPQAKLKAVWADERIASVCSQMANTEQMSQNIAAAKSGAQLSMRDVQKLRDYTVRTASLRCKGCSQICESRVEGDVKIADTLRYLMYADSYGNLEEARSLYRALTPNERNFEHLDLGPAASACPQGIDIARRLKDAAVYLA